MKTKSGKVGQVVFNKEEGGIEIYLKQEKYGGHTYTDEDWEILKGITGECEWRHHGSKHCYYTWYSAEKYAELKETFLKEWCEFAAAPTGAAAASLTKKGLATRDKWAAKAAERASNKKNNKANNSKAGNEEIETLKRDVANLSNAVAQLLAVMQAK